MAKREGELRLKAEQSFACRDDPSCLEYERYIWEAYWYLQLYIQIYAMNDYYKATQKDLGWKILFIFISYTLNITFYKIQNSEFQKKQTFEHKKKRLRLGYIVAYLDYG